LFVKGLGAPIGSVLLADKATIHRFKNTKNLGRYASSRVSGCSWNLCFDHNVERLAEDHRRAKELANVLSKASWVLRLNLLKLIF
jgi:threonine aldolase